METSRPFLPIAVLISGAGTTLRNLIVKKADSALPIDIRLVISSRSRAGGLEHARAAGISTLVVSKTKSRSPEEFSRAVFDPCRDAQVKLVVMGGFLEHVLIPADFENRVMNIHPALIPAFCGKGYYGSKVHEAVLSYGAKISGCTVHFVDNEYDHGPIILQRAVPVRDDDTPDTLAARVFEAECEAYPEALRMIAAGEIEVVGRKVIRRVSPARL
jgi:phosphoribosylglycinamide formyltransferase-1